MMELIDTPSLVVDAAALEHNLKKMADLAKAKGVKLRPHTKTHKSPYIALKQLEMGATGITVAKLGEAEVMRQHGITDILIAYPIVGKNKLDRLARLARHTDVTVALDSVEVGKGISAVGEKLGKKIPVYVEVDTGLKRCGRDPGDETLRLICELKDLPYIEIAGLMTHGGYAYQAETSQELQKFSQQEGNILVQLKERVRKILGLDIREVSVGSTPTALNPIQIAGVTEMRPGTYVFNDATLLQMGLVEETECALSVYATVVSTPAPDRFIVDAGSKTLTSDKGKLTQGYGLIRHSSGVWITWLSEEHGIVQLTHPHAYKIGDVLKIIPNHVCPVVNLADEFILIKNNKVIETIKIEARGKNK
ncbi:D-serine deaminase-like pyridoxal phosphate-dependent protein [Caldalkalibacillus uzonensis]|uniref:D-serine deaminase-like pyridoxal phosphate-dependent protein n=1 Tax=Caldalkalibacillus uzonensis TaxID=353224 RepID=A0ABU0CPG2_9BACI|nr:alanine racemase [Caldalkalibacillus uzonensis]MDQ0338308.1 D-serine deaminase-like pyridoxal phosphate-dependent protein [Caldalkalibacillus uzonensis]